MRKGSPSAGRRLLARLLAFARPRTASQFLALIFTLLAVVVAVALGIASAPSRQAPGAGILWCAILLILALASRLSPWWRTELEGMTVERAKNYVSSVLILFVALSVSWHLLSSAFGSSDEYMLLGPLSRPPAAILALVAIFCLAVGLLLGVPVGSWISHGYRGAGRRLVDLRERRVLQSEEVDRLPAYAPEAFEDIAQDEPPEETPPPQVEARIPMVEAFQPAPALNAPLLPGIEIFSAPARTQAAPVDLEIKAQRIQETLASFNVNARVVGHHHGPVVTQFDVQPDRGVKVRRITELQNDLALALAAPTIRIQAPVPGKAVIGIEIPNSAATVVSIREMLETDVYQSIASPLRVALGKDVAGTPAIIDLAKMPHLLIAGATGSGKSVCVNTIISCLLFQNTPDQVRLMMIDPKMVELTVYNGVPHLLSPVVTEMDRVVGVLQWAIREMERRYQLFADNTVRNIQRYNEKMEVAGHNRLPYIVLVVDELADLMMVAPEDVEDAICRLAQLARAAGIHLVIATQRPSVDVVTGLIKANFPARIAFAMTSQIDSRTILDTVGAEKLLGRGDMLYLPPDAPKPVRLQGPYLSEPEIERLVEFWQRSPLQAAVQRVAEDEFKAAEKAAADVNDDLFSEAVSTVREFQHASVSLLQRRLRIGYARAARLMDQLEAHGVVGPADGSKQRPVLDPDEGFGAH